MITQMESASGQMSGPLQSWQRKVCAGRESSRRCSLPKRIAEIVSVDRDEIQWGGHTCKVFFTSCLFAGGLSIAAKAASGYRDGSDCSIARQRILYGTECWKETLFRQHWSVGSLDDSQFLMQSFNLIIPRRGDTRVQMYDTSPSAWYRTL
jgi:hypothetical protein